MGVLPLEFSPRSGKQGSVYQFSATIVSIQLNGEMTALTVTSILCKEESHAQMRPLLHKTVWRVQRLGISKRRSLDLCSPGDGGPRDGCVINTYHENTPLNAIVKGIVS